MLAALNGAAADAIEAVGAVAFTVVGALIAVRRPENRLGWLLGGAGVGFAILESASEYAKRALVTAPRFVTGG